MRKERKTGRKRKKGEREREREGEQERAESIDAHACIPINQHNGHQTLINKPTGSIALIKSP